MLNMLEKKKNMNLYPGTMVDAGTEKSPSSEGLNLALDLAFDCIKRDDKEGFKKALKSAIRFSSREDS